MNILLVDDDYPLAYSTAKLIHRLGGHQVYTTDEPAEVFRRCQAGEVNLIMMDVNLPEAQWQGQAVSGADLARFLKNDSKTAHIPIILFTAYAMMTERQDLLTVSQADGFCAKPITDYSALLESIERLAQAN